MSKVDTNMQIEVQDYLQGFGNLIKSDAIADAPERTGFLKSTIYARVKEWVLYIGAWADYAKFQEFGTRYIQGVHFISNAIQNRWPQISEFMNRAIKEAIRRSR